MFRIRPIIAVTQFVLIFPAALFMIAIIARYLLSYSNLPSNIPQQIVTWYSTRLWTLWVLLITLPLIVFIFGCVSLMSNQNIDGVRRTKYVIATEILTAGAILVVVILHMLAN